MIEAMVMALGVWFVEVPNAVWPHRYGSVVIPVVLDGVGAVKALESRNGAPRPLAEFQV